MKSLRHNEQHVYETQTMRSFINSDRLIHFAGNTMGWTLTVKEGKELCGMVDIFCYICPCN